MAKAGFYSTSSVSDCVRCFCCFKDLENWDDDDDPWHEHKKRNKCLFAKLETEETNLTSAQMVQIMEERFRNLNVSPDRTLISCQLMNRIAGETAAEFPDGESSVRGSGRRRLSPPLNFLDKFNYKLHIQLFNHKKSSARRVSAEK